MVKKRDGIRFLLAPTGLRAGVVLISLLWIGVAAIAWHNIGSLIDEGFDVGVGVYLATAIPAFGLIATVFVWPFHPTIVYMDRQGVITTG